MLCAASLPALSVKQSPWRIVSTGIVALVLGACSGGQSANAPAVESAAASWPADITVAAALYQDQRVPEGFYQEVVPDDGFYSTRHIRNTDLAPTAGRPAVHEYELSSDDFSEVLGWSQQVTDQENAARQLVDTRETALFHELHRVDPAAPEFTRRHRVYKASVIDRSLADGDQLARLTKPGFSADDVRQVVEYLWTFSFDNNYGTAIVASSTTQTADQVQHVLLQAELKVTASGPCDLVELYERHYRADRLSGELSHDKQLVRAFSVEREAGNIRLCQ